jgi:hypothetical protein
MSNYKNMRSKKNTDLLNAMANVRKDLYDMKQMETCLKLTNNNNLARRNVGSPLSNNHRNSSFSEPSSGLFKKSNSLKDLQKFETQINSPKSNSKLRPLSGIKLNKMNDFNDIDLFDLDIDESEKSGRKDSGNSQKLQPLNSERIYLNIPKYNANVTNRKNLEELEEEIVIS